MKPQKPRKKSTLTGRKKHLSYEQVQAIRTVLVSIGTARDRALFSLAIDSSLRAHDLVRLRVMDVWEDGAVKERISVTPSKTKDSTGATITFEPIPYTHQLLRELITEEDKNPHDYLFTRARPPRVLSTRVGHISERAYQGLVKIWVGAIGLNSELYGTHSLRRTRPAYIYENTKNIRVCQNILGHAQITTTQNYLGVEELETLDVARKWRM